MFLMVLLQEMIDRRRIWIILHYFKGIFSNTTYSRQIQFFPFLFEKKVKKVKNNNKIRLATWLSKGGVLSQHVDCKREADKLSNIQKNTKKSTIIYSHGEN